MSSASQSAGQHEGAADKRRSRKRDPRGALERGSIRLVATLGIVGIGVALGAILADNKVQGWIIGLVVALVTIVLTTLLRATRPLKATPRGH